MAASPYVTAARLSGDSAAKTAVREVLPNLAVPLATTVGMRFINSVYLVATAAFLGFDPLGTGSDWGTMIQTGVTGISLKPVGRACSHYRDCLHHHIGQSSA